MASLTRGFLASGPINDSSGSGAVLLGQQVASAIDQLSAGHEASSKRIVDELKGIHSELASFKKDDSRQRPGTIPANDTTDPVIKQLIKGVQDNTKSIAEMQKAIIDLGKQIYEAQKETTDQVSKTGRFLDPGRSGNILGKLGGFGKGFGDRLGQLVEDAILLRLLPAVLGAIPGLIAASAAGVITGIVLSPEFRKTIAKALGLPEPASTQGPQPSFTSKEGLDALTKQTEGLKWWNYVAPWTTLFNPPISPEDETKLFPKVQELNRRKDDWRKRRREQRGVTPATPLPPSLPTVQELNRRKRRPGAPSVTPSDQDDQPPPKMHDVPGGAYGIPQFAYGGVVTKPTVALIGEQGPEAVIPIKSGGMQLLSGGFNSPSPDGFNTGRGGDKSDIVIRLMERQTDLLTGILDALTGGRGTGGFAGAGFGGGIQLASLETGGGLSGLSVGLGGQAVPEAKPGFPGSGFGAGMPRAGTPGMQQMPIPGGVPGIPSGGGIPSRPGPSPGVGAPGGRPSRGRGGGGRPQYTPTPDTTPTTPTVTPTPQFAPLSDYPTIKTIPDQRAIPTGPWQPPTEDFARPIQTQGPFDTAKLPAVKARPEPTVTPPSEMFAPPTNVQGTPGGPRVQTFAGGPGIQTIAGARPTATRAEPAGDLKPFDLRTDLTKQLADVKGPAGSISGKLIADKSGHVDAKALYSNLYAKFSNSKLIGFVPPDGAKFGITKGTADEWARFGVANAIQESGLNALNSNPREDSKGLYQFDQSQAHKWGGGNAFDPDASATAFVKYAENRVMGPGTSWKGGSGKGISAMGDIFGSIRRPSETISHLAEAGKAAGGYTPGEGQRPWEKSMQAAGQDTSVPAGPVASTSPIGPTSRPIQTGRPPQSIPTTADARINEYSGVGGFNFMGSQRAREMGMDVAHGSEGLVTRKTAVGDIRVNKYAADDIAGFVNDLHKAGAPLSDFAGTFNDRMIRGSKSRWSQHAYANAIDIQTGAGRGPDNSPALYAWAQKNPEKFAEIQARYHMRNLSSGDWGHFEWTPASRQVTVGRPTQVAGPTIAPDVKAAATPQTGDILPKFIGRDETAPDRQSAIKYTPSQSVTVAARGERQDRHQPGFMSPSHISPRTKTAGAAIAGEHPVTSDIETADKPKPTRHQPGFMSPSHISPRTKTAGAAIYGRQAEDIIKAGVQPVEGEVRDRYHRPSAEAKPGEVDGAYQHETTPISHPPTPRQRPVDLGVKASGPRASELHHGIEVLRDRHHRAQHHAPKKQTPQRHRAGRHADTPVPGNHNSDVALHVTSTSDSRVTI